MKSPQAKLMFCFCLGSDIFVTTVDVECTFFETAADPLHNRKHLYSFTCVLNSEELCCLLAAIQQYNDSQRDQLLC